jgi:hypothetical protein
MSSTPAVQRSSPLPPDRPAAPAAPVAVRRGPASLRYYVCLVVLVSSAAGLHLLATALGIHFVKERVPLKRPLTALDWSKLAPDYRQHLRQPEPINEEMLQKLGTEEYLQVRLLDTRRSPGDLTRVANVLITYYTGQPDLVPHVPEECYSAGGYDQLGDSEDASVQVPGVGAPGDLIPVRVAQFQAREGEQRPTVLYFFHANGQYKSSRDGLRTMFAQNLWERYAYFAKIEVFFTNDSDDPRAQRQAGRAEAIEAVGPLLRKLMPVLLKDHFAWDETRR